MISAAVQVSTNCKTFQVSRMDELVAAIATAAITDRDIDSILTAAIVNPSSAPVSPVAPPLNAGPSTSGVVAGSTAAGLQRTVSTGTVPRSGVSTVASSVTGAGIRSGAGAPANVATRQNRSNFIKDEPSECVRACKGSSTQSTVGTQTTARPNWGVAKTPTFSQRNKSWNSFQTYEMPESESDKKWRKFSEKAKKVVKSKGFKIGTSVAAGTLGVIGAIAAAPLVVAGMGFASGGILAGSAAASMMSALGGGATAAGGTVAILQSIGATGTVLGSVAAASVTAAGGAAVGAATGAGISAAAAAVAERVASDEPSRPPGSRMSRPLRERSNDEESFKSVGTQTTMERW